MNWEHHKPIITEAYFTAINSNNIELFKIIKENRSTLEQVFPLIKYIIERVNAISVLTANELLWDAEIVGRSAIETIVKYAFIVEADESERPTLLNEFWNELSEIYTVKLSEQAKKNLKHTNESEIHRLAYNPLIISESEQERLRTKWTKSSRTKIEQKWSFTGIINFLAKKNKGTPLECIEFLTHSYRISSHVTHGDETGINLIMERESREESERNAVHNAHYLRLLSDCFSYCLMTALYTTQYLKIDPIYFLDLSNSLKEFVPLIEQYHKVPFEDKIYDKYK